MSHVESAEALKSQLASAERTGVGRGYPLALREAAVEHMVARRAEGASLFEIATEIGVQPITLSRWARRGARAEGSFRAVRVVESAPASLVVHGPHGLRIEGDASTIAELLRSLG